MEITDELKEKTLQSYKDADENGRKLLQEIFGKEFFARQDLELILDYEDACKYLGRDPQENLPYKDAKTPQDQLSNLQRMHDTFCEAINKMDNDFIADFTDGLQRKFYAIVVVDSYGGVGFSHTRCDNSHTGSTVGSRFCYHRTPKIAEYVCKKMLPIIQQKLTLK